MLRYRLDSKEYARISRRNMAAATPTLPPKPPARPLPKHLQFLFGGTAGMAATCVVQPIDLIKTRMQLATKAGGDA